MDAASQSGQVITQSASPSQYMEKTEDRAAEASGSKEGNRPDSSHPGSWLPPPTPPRNPRCHGGVVFRAGSVIFSRDVRPSLTV
uniref:Uncharacterized protein n=1 Tax=Mesocestoides corti TaxID=53468 RepID=A0A5K3G325_MESCO